MTGHGAETAYAIAAAILGPGIPVLTWLILTWSYRQDKLMILRETFNHVSEEDLGCGATINPMGRTPSRARFKRGFADLLMFGNTMSDQAVQTNTPSAIQTTARQIVVRCLRRWDGFLGFRAGRDGLGNPLGIWRGRFEGVRYAVMLLAMRKLNNQLKASREEGEAPHAGEAILAMTFVPTRCSCSQLR